ncbi:MAG: hypothetical protein AAB074_10500 [Planctomycetota bacterium]
MRLAPLLALLSLPAFADVLSPTLDVKSSGDNLVLRLEGTADIPVAAADWAPLVQVEYLFVPLRVQRRIERIPGLLRWTDLRVTEGREISLGFARARIVSDAVADNLPYLEARPFVVAGQFAGLYRARLVLDPARQSVRLRARSLPAAAAQAEARWGDPADLPRKSREMQLAVEEDAAALQRLARDLESLWNRWRAAPQAGDEWTSGLESWRARFERLPARNDLRPAHSIVSFMPAARSAIGEACESLVSLAETCEKSMGEPAGKRLASRVVEAAALRAHEALTGLDRAAGRREPGPDLEPMRAALATLRAAPDNVRGWYEASQSGGPGHDAEYWPAQRMRFESVLTESLFMIGRSAPPSLYADLAAIARLLFAETAPASGRNPSLLAAYSSRILKETAAPLDGEWLKACGQELKERLSRVERVLESR